ncbi:MAG TPA: TIGR02300 family protein [Beijerinckiaceae bacterium]|nr:TIGR02300 family protein [Beijerinckiaceae bacterium]
MAKPELGIKRQCLSCGAKFYDLNRDPILCPKCGAAFQVQQLIRRGETAKAADDADENAADAAGAVMVPLEEADADGAGKDLPGDDIDLGEDLGDDEDDTFLESEEEEDDGDVSDLIGSDIEDDEES